MECFASQDPCSYSLYFDLNVCFRARKVSGAFEKRAPAPSFGVNYNLTLQTSAFGIMYNLLTL